MKAKYTPGPWFPVEFAGFHVIKTEPYYDAGQDLLDVEECQNAESNAKLISAAPDLLESLQEMLEHHNSDEWKIVKAKAYAAIKKAID